MRIHRYTYETFACLKSTYNLLVGKIYWSDREPAISFVMFAALVSQRIMDFNRFMRKIQRKALWSMVWTRIELPFTVLERVLWKKCQLSTCNGIWLAYIHFKCIGYLLGKRKRAACWIIWCIAVFIILTAMCVKQKYHCKSLQNLDLVKFNLQICQCERSVRLGIDFNKTSCLPSQVTQFEFGGFQRKV